LVISLVLVATFGLSVGSSLASELAMHKYAVEELKRVCEKTGGSFSRVMDYFMGDNDASRFIGCARNSIHRRFRDKR